MTEKLRPRSNNSLAQMEARLLALEQQLAQTPSRSVQRPAQRLAVTIHQADHGFIAGDAVGESGGVWEKSGYGSPGIQPTIGIVESVIGLHGFTVVLSGAIDTSGFPEDFGTCLVYGVTGLTNTVSDARFYQAINQGFVQLRPGGGGQPAWVFPDASAASKAWLEYGGQSTTNYGWCYAPTLGYILPTFTYLVAHGTFATSTTGPQEWTCAGVESGYPKSIGENYGIKRAVVRALSGTDPLWTVEIDTAIIYPTDGIYPKQASYCLSELAGSASAAPACFYTNTLSKAAGVNARFASVGTRETAWTVGDTCAILGIDEDGTVVLMPALDQLRNVKTDDTGSPLVNHDVLEWSATAKKWLNMPHYPPGGVDGMVLGISGGNPTWVTGGSGGGLSLSCETNYGLAFSDDTLGPKTSTASLRLSIFQSKGQMLYGTDSGQVGAACPPEQLDFPASGSQNALLVADKTTLVPKWFQTVELGDTAGSRGGLKINLSATTNLDLGHTSATTCKLTLNGVTIDFGSTPPKTGKTLKLVELDVCDFSGIARKILTLASDAY